MDPFLPDEVPLSLPASEWKKTRIYGSLEENQYTSLFIRSGDEIVCENCTYRINLDKYGVHIGVVDLQHFITVFPCEMAGGRDCNTPRMTITTAFVGPRFALAYYCAYSLFCSL